MSLSKVNDPGLHDLITYIFYTSPPNSKEVNSANVNLR